MIKLSDYAKTEGITYRTAYNHFKQGLIPNAHQTSSGSIYINTTYSDDGDVWLNISEILKGKGYSIKKEVVE